MKRNMKFIKELLNQIELLTPDRDPKVNNISYVLENYDDETIEYNLNLLRCAGFIKYENRDIHGSINLTWRGHNLLDALNDNLDETKIYQL